MVGLQNGVTLPIFSILPIPEWVEKFFSNMSLEINVYNFIAIVVAAPILEELIFRGIILDGLLHQFSPIKSILLSSFLFGIIHLNPWQFVSAMVIGSFAGWVYYKTGKLTLPILIHMVNNLLAFIGMYFIDSSTTMNEYMSESTGEIGVLLIGTIIALLIAGTCIFLLLEEFDHIKMNPWRKSISLSEPGGNKDHFID